MIVLKQLEWTNERLRNMRNHETAISQVNWLITEDHDWLTLFFYIGIGYYQVWISK